MPIMGKLLSKKKRPAQVQDERGDAELGCECDSQNGRESQECGPSVSGQQQRSGELDELPEHSRPLVNQPMTSLPVADSNPPFNSLETNMCTGPDYVTKDNLTDEVPTTSANQPSALVAGPSAGQSAFPLPHPLPSGPQPFPPATQPPSLGLRPSTSAETHTPSPESQALTLGNHDQQPIMGSSAGSDGSSTNNDNDPCLSNITSSAGNESEEDKKKLKPDDSLEMLWDNPYFQDDLRHSLDYVHSSDSILGHRHLMEEFNIPSETRDTMSCSNYSPSERMLDYLRSKEPVFKIRDLCEILKKGKAFRTRRLLQKAIEAGKIAESDYVTDVLDKDLNFRTDIITQLDSTGLWKQVSDKLKIRKEMWCLFERDPTSRNPAETFFEILWSQSPKLKIKALKDRLRELHENGLVQKMSDIPDNELLSILRSKPTLMYDDIQPKLNEPKSSLLMKLAEKFQKGGYLKDVDIKTFQTNESYESPTEKMMEYILFCDEKEYKIQDLVDKLLKIKRTECCDIVSKYVKGLRYEDIGSESELANSQTQAENNDAGPQ